MQTILHICCSPRGVAAFSRRASNRVIAGLLARHPGARVIQRDLSANPPPLVDAGFSNAILSGGAASPALAVSEALIEELEGADSWVIATPMHNYGVPAVLKAWVDQVVRIHRTFRSTPAGKIGLLADRPVFVCVASGGWFSGPSPIGTPAQPDFLRPYLTAVLATIGLHDVRFITLEGVARGTEAADLALAKADAAITAALNKIG